jgi:hypothetical protein
LRALFTADFTQPFRKSALIAAGLILTIGAAAVPAAAAPLAPTAAISDDSLAIPVRDGCGPGQPFSNSRQMCVEDFGGRRDFRGDDRRGNFRDECGRGLRFSNNRGRCVPIDEGRRGRDDGAAAAAVAVGVIGAAIGAAASNNDRQGRRVDRNRIAANIC